MTLDIAFLRKLFTLFRLCYSVSTNFFISVR